MGLTSWATIERHGGGAWSSWTKVVNSNPSALGMPRGVQLALAPNGDMMLLTNGGPLKWQRKPAGGAWSDPAELPGSDVSDPGNIYGYGIDMSSVRLRATASSAFVATWNHQYTHSQYAAVAARDVGFSKADELGTAPFGTAGGIAVGPGHVMVAWRSSDNPLQTEVSSLSIG